MTDVATVRRLLRDFLGTDQFRKLVATVPPSLDGDRLRFWQERALDNFHAAHPNISVSQDDLTEICRICQLHECELMSTRIPVVEGCVDFAPDFWEERNTHYPNAQLPFISTEGREMDEEDVMIWYCPTCETIRLQRQH